MLEQLLIDTHYNKKETKILVKEFTQAFTLGYRGPKYTQEQERNSPFTVGNSVQLSNKVMSDIKAPSCVFTLK